MQFKAESDSGDAIFCWICPDNPSITPAIVITAEGMEPREMAPTSVLAHLVDIGAHNTGMVGFSITEKQFPGLARAKSLSISERETGFCVYRRFEPARHIKQKLCFLLPGAMPQRGLLTELGRHFAYNQNFIETNSNETILNMIHHTGESVLLTGRINYGRYSDALRFMGFKMIALLRDPFEELAERLLFLRAIAGSASRDSLLKLARDLEPAIALAGRIQFDDPKKLRATMRGLSAEERGALSNPLTAMFGCQMNERPERHHVTVALNNLAQYELVGVVEFFDDFKRILADLLRADATRGVELRGMAITSVVARALAKTSSAVDLLDNDLALYSYVEEAVASGARAAIAES